MLTKTIATKWLYHGLREKKQFIHGLYLFGSVQKGHRFPRDCDVLVITDCHPDSSDWAELKSALVSLEKRFVSVFRIPLNFIFMNKSEFNSLYRFREKA